KDAHDVLGTYRVLSTREFMGRSAQDDNPDVFIARVRATHREIMAGRPEERPGQWKIDENMAGTTVFVHPDLVEGTLRKGFEFVVALSEPFHRAMAMMFVLSEVHPFSDGNGRVSRALMNAEVIAAGEPRILVPIIVRDEYIAGLRAITRDGYPNTLVEVLSFGQRLTRASISPLTTSRSARSGMRTASKNLDQACGRVCRAQPKPGTLFDAQLWDTSQFVAHKTRFVGHKRRSGPYVGHKPPLCASHPMDNI
ncbi:MAG: Fic family protein, partial [Gemmatimonas sp.]